MKSKLLIHNTRRSKTSKSKIFFGMVLFVVIFILTTFLFLTNKKPQEKIKTKTLTIALVNEDITSKFNNQDYNFGKSFVDLVSSDNKYNWQVVSRSVAEKAYSDGSIDGVIYLPQTFSTNLVTLQDINPTQAKVDYKVQPQEDELSEKIVQDKITSVLYNFNQNIVKMYYSSVARNIAEAESQMNAVVGKQENLVSNLSAKIKSPFENVLPNYTTFIAETNSLNTLNKGNVSLQKSFTDNTKNLMKQTSDNFSSQLPQIRNYFDTQKNIAEFNIKNANEGLTNQAVNDETFYFDQFNGFNTETVTGLTTFYQKNQSGNEEGLLAGLTQTVLNYNMLIDGTRENIDHQISILTSKQDELLNLENDLYHQFFSQNTKVTIDDYQKYTDVENFDNAKTALSSKLQTSLGRVDNLSDTGYLVNLTNLISGISLSVSDYKLDELVTNGTIDKATKKKYEDELEVVSRYATAFGLTTGSLTLGEVPTSDTVNQTLTRTIKLTVPSGTKYQSSVFPEKVTIKAATKVGLTVNDDNSITLENPLRTTSDGSNSKGIPMTFEFQLSVNLGNQSSYKFDTTWVNQTDGTKISEYTDTFALMPKETTESYNQYIENNFQVLSGLFEKIDRVTNMITTIYASSDEDYSVFLVAETQDDFKNRSQQSIFNMYGNMDLSTISARLSDLDVQDFLDMGQQNLKKVIQIISRLNESIENLQGNKSLLQNHLPEKYFTDNLSALNNWYAQMTSKIDTSFESWRQQAPTLLEIKEWKKSDTSKLELYKETSNSLYDQIQTLIGTTQKSTMEITENSTTVKDNFSQFEELVGRATYTQKEAQNLLSTTDDLVSVGNNDVGKSKEFYEGFSKTLANTRTKGVNTQEIYNFFASPITTSNVTPRRSGITEAKKAFDIRWVMVFTIGLFTGMVVILLGKLGLQRVRKGA